MALIQLIYVSSLVDPDQPAMLPALLQKSVHYNRDCGITGMMLYAEGNVLQVLEGEQAAVQVLFEKIERDSRHRDIYVLLQADIQERAFADWSMGFRGLSTAELKASPEAEYLFRCRTDELAARVQPGDALDVLKSFAV